MKKIIFVALFLVGMTMSTNAETDLNKINNNETEITDFGRICFTHTITTEVIVDNGNGTATVHVHQHTSTTCIDFDSNPNK